MGKILLLLVLTGLIVNAATSRRVEARVCSAQNNAFTAINEQIDNGKITVNQRTAAAKRQLLQATSQKVIGQLNEQIRINDGSITRADDLKEKINAVDCGGFLR